MRSLWVCAGLVLAIGGCAGSPLKTKAPDGLLFDCDGGRSATLKFNDGGYLPESTALARARDGSQFQQARSTALLTFDGSSQAMVAEWAEFGLRYRSNEAGADGRHTILSVRGEQAVIGRRAAVPAAGEDPAGERIAQCRRAGRDGAAPGGHGGGDTHRR